MIGPLFRKSRRSRIGLEQYRVRFITGCSINNAGKLGENHFIMKIYITTGTGTGPTSLAAFDAALLDAGVANYNLLPLSSVIPPGSEIRCGRFAGPEAEYGYRLYVVIAYHQTTLPGQEAWAGLGWTQDPHDGKGLFVEHHDFSEIEVRRAIQASLESMIARRNYPYGPIHSKVAGIKCVDRPVCAVSIAVYHSQGWL